MDSESKYKDGSVVVLYILASFFQTFVLSSTIAFLWRRTSMTMCFCWNSLLVRNFLVWIVMSFTMAAHLRAAREEKNWLMSTSLCWTLETIIARVTLNSWIHFWVQSAFCFTKSWPITFQALAIPSEIFLEAASPRSGCQNGRCGLSFRPQTSCYVLTWCKGTFDIFNLWYFFIFNSNLHLPILISFRKK